MDIVPLYIAKQRQAKEYKTAVIIAVIVLGTLTLALLYVMSGMCQQLPNGYCY